MLQKLLVKFASMSLYLFFTQPLQKKKKAFLLDDTILLTLPSGSFILHSDRAARTAGQVLAAHCDGFMELHVSYVWCSSSLVLPNKGL